MSYYKILFRRGTTAEWQSNNPVLSYGEVGCEIGVNDPQLKVGDGVTPWNDLPYAARIGMPTGGNAGDILMKNSSTDYDNGWLDQTQFALDLMSLYRSSTLPVVESGSFTISSTHAERVVRCNGSSMATITIPTDAANDLPDGYWTALHVESVHGIALSYSGITLTGTPDTIISQNETVVLMKTTTADTWMVIGGTVP